MEIMSETTFDDLPPESAAEIFKRLPVKTLIRSTSVSKSWYSLITNPSFISAHIEHTISCVDQNAVLVIPCSNISQEKYASLLSYDTDHVFDKYEIPFTTRTDTLQLVGSVNGLLCLTDASHQYAGRELYFWNPSIRKYKSFVTCDHIWEDRSFYLVGLGVVQLGDDIRVVRIMYRELLTSLVGHHAPVVEVFSLREKKWREIENPGVPRVADNVIGITVDAMVYWVDNACTEKHDEVWLISFDFKNEVLGLLKLGDEVRYCLGESASFNLMKFKDSLAVCVFQINANNGIYSQPCHIWLMSQEDGIISWTFLYKIVYEQVLWPLGITKSGSLLLTSYNEHPGTLAIVPPCVDTSFIESLVMHEGGAESLEREICKVSCLGSGSLQIPCGLKH